MKATPHSRSRHRDSRPSRQRGGFVVGVVVGLLIGLAVSLGVALYVTKVPIPFVTKVPSRPAGQDAAEAERNRKWDPNGGLAGKNPAPSGAAASATSTIPTVIAPATTAAPAVAPTAPPALATANPNSTVTSTAPVVPKPAPGSARPAAPTPESLFGSSSDPFLYFVQAGAYARTEDAEQQRAKLAMLGLESRLTEREQSGRTVFRVRVGPFEKKADADAAKDKLSGSGVEAALVRVQK